MAYSSLQEVHHRVMQCDVGDFWQSRHRQKVGLACDCLDAVPLSVKWSLLPVCVSPDCGLELGGCLFSCHV